MRTLRVFGPSWGRRFRFHCGVNWSLLPKWPITGYYRSLSVPMPLAVLHLLQFCLPILFIHVGTVGSDCELPIISFYSSINTAYKESTHFISDSFALRCLICVLFSFPRIFLGRKKVRSTSSKRVGHLLYDGLLCILVSLWGFTRRIWEWRRRREWQWCWQCGWWRYLWATLHKGYSLLELPLIFLNFHMYPF